MNAAYVFKNSIFDHDIWVHTWMHWYKPRYQKGYPDCREKILGSEGGVIHTCNQEVQNRLPGLEEFRGGKTDGRRQGSTKTKYYENIKMKPIILYVN